MIPIDTLVLFVATTFLVVLSPGRAAIAVTGEAASGGFKRAFLAILGIASANVAFFVLYVAGIAVLIIASNVLFKVIKWIGVAYLLYLGVGAIFGSAGPLKVSASKNWKLEILTGPFSKTFSSRLQTQRRCCIF